MNVVELLGFTGNDSVLTTLLQTVPIITTNADGTLTSIKTLVTHLTVTRPSLQIALTALTLH